MLEEPAVPREGRSMSGVRNWRIGAPVVAFVASGGVALLVGIVVAMPIDLLMDMEAFALLSVTAIAAMGWLALQRQSAASGGVFEVEHDRHSE
jgi:amino acid transporter